jgi:hypothetical protein
MDTMKGKKQMDAETKKQVKAKLYNLKSQMDGMVGMVENGILDRSQVCDAVSTMAAKFCEEVARVSSQ